MAKERQGWIVADEIGQRCGESFGSVANVLLEQVGDEHATLELFAFSLTQALEHTQKLIAQVGPEASLANQLPQSLRTIVVPAGWLESDD